MQKKYDSSDLQCGNPVQYYDDPAIHPRQYSEQEFLGGFSDVYVAVLGVYFKLQTFIYMPANGIVQGMRPLVGYNYGAGEKERVKSIIRYSLLSAGCIMLDRYSVVPCDTGADLCAV